VVYAGLSSNYMVGKFMVFSADNKVNRFVLSNNGPKGFDMALHPNARLILGKSNIAFMHGPSHKALRNSFLPLFTQVSQRGMYWARSLRDRGAKGDGLLMKSALGASGWVDGGVRRAMQGTVSYGRQMCVTHGVVRARGCACVCRLHWVDTSRCRSRRSVST
jgi:hypothetical protein